MKRIILLLTVVVGFSTIYAQQVQDPPRDRAYDKVAIGEKRIVPYDHLREADVFWEKRIWRVIDTREKMNLPFRYPKAPFINILRDNAIEGAITVYDAVDDEFTSPMTPQEIAEAGVGTADTIFVIDPVTLQETREITNPEFDPGKIKKYRLKEDWIFDEETSTLVVRIIGLAPIMEVIDDQGNIRGDKVLFWVYYPEVRQILANQRVFNDKNDATTQSWEDILEMRFFASYIIKESNVYDRRIQDYAAGIDALLEADRIENELFEKEHDLWSF